MGDGIVDVIERGDGRGAVTHPGGAGLNLAVGLARLGTPATLLYLSSDDPYGELIRDHLATHAVRAVGLPGTRPSGIATSVPGTAAGEVEYSFNDSMLNRRYRFTRDAVEAVSAASAVAVTAYPFDDPGSVRRYLELVDGLAAAKVVDPNPRPALVKDRNAYRTGFEEVARACDVIKLSDEDVEVLYGDDGSPVAGLTALGKVVVVTHGARGASVHLPDGSTISRAAFPLGLPVVDTLGAGDAALAAVVAGLAVAGPSLEAGLWGRLLEQAMVIAAWTCRSPGGLLRRPGDVAGAGAGVGRAGVGFAGEE